MGEKREIAELSILFADVIIPAISDSRFFLSLSDYLALGEALGIQTRVSETREMARLTRNFLLKNCVRLGYRGWLRWLAAAHGVTADEKLEVHPPLVRLLNCGNSVAVGFAAMERAVFRGDLGLASWLLGNFRSSLAAAEKYRLFEDACFWCGPDEGARFAMVRMLCSEFGIRELFPKNQPRTFGFWAWDIGTHTPVLLRPRNGSAPASRSPEYSEEAVPNDSALAVCFRRGNVSLQRWLARELGAGTTPVGALFPYRRCLGVSTASERAEEGAFEYQLFWERCAAGTPLPDEAVPPAGEAEEGDRLSRLLRACRDGHTARAEAEAGKDLREADRRSAFQVSCATGRLEVAKWCAQYFAIKEADCVSDDSFAFWAACAGGHLDVARWLADAYNLGCEVAAARGCSAMRFAAFGGHWDVVEWLAERFGLMARNAEGPLLVPELALRLRLPEIAVLVSCLNF